MQISRRLFLISQRFSKLVYNPEVLHEELSCEGISEGDEWACQVQLNG